MADGSQGQDPDADMLQRSTSPIFFARHSPASKAQDISRLLDPAYSSAAFAPNSAYVDRHGELHDPDYRHFPVAQPRRRASNITVSTRPRWESFNDDDDEPEDDHFNPRRTSFSSYQPRRPVYSYSYVPTLVIPDSADSRDTILDDADADASPRPSGVSRILSRTKREFSRKRRSLDGASHASSSPYYTSTLLTPDTPTTTATVVSEEHEPDTASLHAPSHCHPLSHTLSRFSCHSATPIHAAHPEQRSASPSPEYTPTHDAEREQVWTPTCAQALRRQWQAVSLRIRFGVFRAQRRMKSRLAML
ncbi:hypothetical protein C0993_010096 [Termitomyces sp. T159_Od127]|nr:hypothetical protein C0993_010096 [Termitomyces sp. T159_Od127]